MVKKLVVPPQRKVFAELNKPPDSVVLNKVMAFSYVADSAVEFCGKLGRFGVQQESLSARRRLKAQENPNYRCLTGAVSSQQAVDAASRNF